MPTAVGNQTRRDEDGRHYEPCDGDHPVPGIQSQCQYSSQDLAPNVLQGSRIETRIRFAEDRTAEGLGQIDRNVGGTGRADRKQDARG